jgi:hypothetical protein
VLPPTTQAARLHQVHRKRRRTHRRSTESAAGCPTTAVRKRKDKEKDGRTTAGKKARAAAALAAPAPAWAPAEDAVLCAVVHECGANWQVRAQLWHRCAVRWC